MFYTLLIFLIILTIYLHINYQLKKSNELEIYNIDFISKEQLEEISKLRQPFVFDYDLMNDGGKYVYELSKYPLPYLYFSFTNNVYRDPESPGKGTYYVWLTLLS